MKIKILIYLILLSGILFAQDERLKTGFLTTGDSTITFYSAGREWVRIHLVDSASTNDSCVVEMKNLANDVWTTAGVKEQLDDDYVSVLVPTADVTGKIYVVWVMYPTNIRLRKTDVHSLDEIMYYAIKSKGENR